MALLPQTADRVAFLYWPATASFLTLPNPPTALLWFNSPFYGYTVSWAAPFDGSVTRKRVLPLTVISPLNVWQAQTSWPINMNIILTFGTLVNPPAGSKRVSGVFQDQNGSPIARTGFLYDRSTGAFLTTFSSSAIDGSWNGYVPTTNPVFAVLIPALADSRNAVAMDNLTPI